MRTTIIILLLARFIAQVDIGGDLHGKNKENQIQLPTTAILDFCCGVQEIDGEEPILLDDARNPFNFSGGISFSLKGIHGLCRFVRPVPKETQKLSGVFNCSVPYHKLVACSSDGTWTGKRLLILCKVRCGGQQKRDESKPFLAMVCHDLTYFSRSTKRYNHLSRVS